MYQTLTLKQNLKISLRQFSQRIKKSMIWPQFVTPFAVMSLLFQIPAIYLKSKTNCDDALIIDQSLTGI